MLRGLDRKGEILLLSDGLGWRQQAEEGQGRVLLGADWCSGPGSPLPAKLFSCN